MTSSWQRRAFAIVIVACVQFVVLTLVAMLLYPGGTLRDPNTTGYSFYGSFLSELGLTRTHAGGSNLPSFILFVVALTLAGGGLVLFFVAFASFFRRTPLRRVVSALGSLAGIASGICFVGVAFTPADLFAQAHGQFVMWAFQLFPVAVVLYTAAILLEPNYPNRYAVVFAGFAVLLILYLILLRTGPAPDLSTGLAIQATGQKAIVYASVITIGVQALGARRQAR